MTIEAIKHRTTPLLGLYVCSSDPNLVEIAARAGIGYIRIDLEHGMLSYAEVRELIRTASLWNIDVQVRVSDLSDVTRMLDFGVNAIIVPDIEAREDAERAVRMVKYAPLGARGFNNAPRFLQFSSDGFMDYLKTANDSTMLIIQLESRQALDNIDEILSVPGIDAVSSGKGDLSQSYGLLGQNTHPQILEKEAFIIQKAVEHGKLPTALSTGCERTQQLLQAGVRMITIGSDMDVYAAAIRMALKKHAGE